MLPSLYHAHLKLHPEDLPFWLELAQQNPDPILELGCGTGRLLLALASAGHKIFGLDNDFQMLEYLRKNLPAQLISAQNVIQADFTRFHLALSFGLIFMPCNTYSTLPASDRLSLLICVQHHLKPQGLFAASLPNPEVLKQIPSRSDSQLEEVFPHPDTGEPVQVLSAWERSERYVTVQWHYDHLQMDGRVHRSRLEAKHNLTTAQTYHDELSRAGFRSIRLLGDFDHSPYQADSPLLIFLAHRHE